jgi:hypothetical protein
MTATEYESQAYERVHMIVYVCMHVCMYVRQRYVPCNALRCVVQDSMRRSLLPIVRLGLPALLYRSSDGGCHCMPCHTLLLPIVICPAWTPSTIRRCEPWMHDLPAAYRSCNHQCMYGCAEDNIFVVANENGAMEYE